jgi:hypothetical protein
VTHGTPFQVSGDGYSGDTSTFVFDLQSIEYQGKLHIVGQHGIWTLNAGDTIPTHLDSAVFDGIDYDLFGTVIFDGKLWVSGGNKTISWNGYSATEYTGFYGTPIVWDNELFLLFIDVYKLQDSTFVLFKSGANIGNSLAIWDDKLYYAGASGLSIRTLDKNGNITQLHGGIGGVIPADDDGIIIAKITTGTIAVEHHYYKTIGGGGGHNSIEIKIVGMAENEQYDEPFEEGHRVVVRDSPTGFSREYGIRDGELTDTDSSDNSAIRGNVDTYADLLALDTSDVALGIKIGDGYIVEEDENHDDDSAIYTWDGAEWNFTHLWKISLELKSGTYAVTTTPFTFNKFAAKNENAEEFDVLEVSFAVDCDVNIAAASGKSGDTRIMIFNIAAGQTVNLSFGFANKLVDGAELTLTSGAHVVSIIRASTPIINIAPYGVNN